MWKFMKFSIYLFELANDFGPPIDLALIHGRDRPIHWHDGPIFERAVPIKTDIWTKDEFCLWQ